MIPIEHVVGIVKARNGHSLKARTMKLILQPVVIHVIRDENDPDRSVITGATTAQLQSPAPNMTALQPFVSGTMFRGAPTPDGLIRWEMVVIVPWVESNPIPSDHLPLFFGGRHG